MIPAVLQLLLSWLLLFFIFAGIGLLFQRIVSPDVGRREGLADSFWTGWIAALAALQLWNIFFPVNEWAFGAIMVCSLLGLAGERAVLRERLRRFVQNYKAGTLLTVLIAVGIATQALGPPLHYDNGLYHFSMIRWAQAHPVVPGLANLQVHLAYGAYYLYPAVLEASFWPGRSHHVANSLLILVVMSQFVGIIFRMFAGGGIRRSELFALAIAPVVFLLPLQAWVAGPSTDLVIYILDILLIRKLIDLLEDKAKGAALADDHLFQMIVLSVGGIMIKLNFAVFAAGVLLVALFHLWRQKALGIQALRLTAICFSLFLIPWIIRNIIWSGYPLYPAPLFPLPVEWRLPQASIENFNTIIRAWARMPFTHWSEVKGWNWLAPWWLMILETQTIRVVVPLLLAMGGSFLAFLLSASAYGREMFRQRGWLALLPAVIMLVVCFFLAPDIRFAGSSLWILAAGVWTFFICGLNRLEERTKKAVMAGFAVLVTGVLLFHVPALRWYRDFSAAPRAALVEFRTDSGLRLFVPQQGDQCWDAPLPCTPYPHPRLQARREGDPGSGFIVVPRDESDVTVGHHK